jgi:hypothetical protein
MLLLTAQVADTKPCYYTVDTLRRSTAASKSSTSTNPDPITPACLQAAELGDQLGHETDRRSLRAKRTRWEIQFQPGSPGQCVRRYPERHGDPCQPGRPQGPTGEIYRQLRRPRTAAAGGRGRPPQAAARRAGLEMGREESHRACALRACALCRVKSRTTVRARLVPGISPGQPWSFASRSGPLVTAVVRWPMPQVCPKRTLSSTPAPSHGGWP